MNGTETRTATAGTELFGCEGWRRFLMPVVSLGLFFIALYAIHRLLATVSYSRLIAELGSLPPERVVLAVLFTAGSFVALTGYDWSALMFIRKRIPYRTVALASFCGYAIANTVGFSLISGGSVRYRVYLTAGLDGADVTRVTLFSALALGIGVHAVGAAALSVHPEVLAGLIKVPPGILRGIGIAALLLLVAALAFTFLRREPIRAGSWQFRLPSGAVTTGQLLISIADICFAGACLYVLLPATHVPFLAFLVVFAIATVAGIASHVPGGLGVFEGAMLFVLGGTIPAQKLSAALIAYRAVYYLLPLLVATLVLAVREVHERVEPVTTAVRVFHSWSTRLVPGVSGVLAFTSGFVLLVSSATPAAPGRLSVLKDLMPLMVVEVSNILAAAVGLALLVVARGLFRRLNGACLLALGFCLAGAVLSLAKGIDYEEGLVLLVTALVVYASRREFYRRTSLLDSPFTLGWVLSVLGAVGAMYWITLFSFKHVEYAHMLWWQFEYDAEVSRSLRAELAVTAGLLVLGVQRLLRPPRRRPRPPARSELDRAEVILRRQDDADANLALMGDKHLLFADGGDAFLMYGLWRSSWIAMGDPIGAPAAVDELAWRFRELADREGARVAFYQTRPETLPLYLDMALTPLKLGEEAVVDLRAFSLQGSRRKEMRHTLSRGERDGLSLEILPRRAVADAMKVLEAISSGWLEHKSTREKGFSLGAFIPDYVQRFDVALVRQQDKPVAFATLLTTDTRAEVSIDLMRHLPEASPYTMMFLFIRLLEHFKEQGCRRLALGMAPLSGLENHPLAPLWHRFGHLIYNRGEYFYNFQGLRQFKEKFDPIWEPRYLVTGGGLNPLIVVADVAALIGGGVKGVFTK